MQTSLDPADSWYDISAGEYSDYAMCEGDPAINWKERGYSTILDILMVLLRATTARQYICVAVSSQYN